MEVRAEAKLEEYRGKLLEYCPHEVLKTLNIALPESRSPEYCPKTIMDSFGAGGEGAGASAGASAGVAK